MNFSSLPKIELHVHLDCSISLEAAQLIDPEISPEAYMQRFVAPAKCIDLADYLTRAIAGIELMQTQAALRIVTLDLFRQFAADGVIYAEIRFAPLEHLQGGLTAVEVVQTVLSAVESGRQQTGIEAGIILCTLRHYTEAQSLELAQLAAQFKNTAVAGMDIAADEANFSVQNHIAAFQYAQKQGINCTAHAGEARGADSVWETIRNFSPRRIGHGVRSVEDPQLLDYLLKNQIHLEVCSTSNIQTNVYETMRDHPIDQLYRMGIPLGINTDARTISNVSLSQEYQTLHEIFQWEKADFLKCNLSALQHAFASKTLKSVLLSRLLKGFGD